MVAHRPLVSDPSRIRLGVAGYVPENDHPYSWSAIINGYDATAMNQFAHPMIGQYLGARREDEFGIEGAKVTHIWCDERSDAQRIAQAARIAQVVDRPEDLIGRVDAVLIPTDRGNEHVVRARPFVEAGVPVFIDKPLCDNAEDLAVFEHWHQADRAILSCSAMRYAVEFEKLRAEQAAVGELRLITVVMAKSWPRYGIHALEAAYPFLAPGRWLSCADAGTDCARVVRYQHADGPCLVIGQGEDWFGGFGVLGLYGTGAHRSTQFRDSFTAFKRQLSDFVAYLRTGVRPFAFDQTRELIQMLLAADASRARGGASVQVHEV